MDGMAVYAIDRADTSPFDSRIIYRKNDMTDKASIAEDLAGIDIVYYLASATIPLTSWENPLIELEENLAPFIEFGHAAARSKVRKIAFVSSAGTIYGPSKEKVGEHSDKKPYSPYGIIKLAMENFLNYFKARYNIDFDVYRISNVYGAGQNTSKGLGLINTFIEKIISEGKINIYGSGEALRNYIYVNDVAKILCLSLTNGFGKSSTYNVSSGDSLTINQIVEILKSTVKEDFSVENVKVRESDYSAVEIDNAELIRAMPEFTFTPIGEGIARTYSYIRASMTDKN